AGAEPAAAPKAPADAKAPAQAKPELKPAAAAPHADKKQPAKAEKRPRLDELKQQVRKEAGKQRWHPKPGVKRQEMVDAAHLPEPDQNEQSSKEKSEVEMGEVAEKQKAQQQQQAQSNAEAFKKAFRALVAQQEVPRSEDAVKEYADKAPVQQSTEAVQSDVAQKQGQMVKPLQDQMKVLPKPDDPKKAVKLKPAGAAPKPG